MDLKKKHLFQIGLDIIAINLAWFGALILRFDGQIPQVYLDHAWQIGIFVTGVRIGVFLALRLYQSLWRYSSIPELFLVTKAVTISTLIIWIFALSAQRAGWLPFLTPKAIGIIDWMLAILALGGLRFTLRLRREWKIARLNARNAIRKRLLIVGAGAAGSMIIREILREQTINYLPIGFVDDDPNKQGHKLHGIPILGTSRAIPQLIKQYEIQEVILAIPSASRRAVREILDICQQEAVHISMLSAALDPSDSIVAIRKLREVAIEDLLGREPAQLDLASITNYLNEQRILITGAGGSIGAELCRQLAGFNPAVLLLLGRGENSIYEIDQELAMNFPKVAKEAIIADIRDRAKLAQVFAEYRPTVVFHAAAHKHVPLMEREPDEAIKNNIFGTKNVIELAVENNCQRFVLISTDKAVNPTSIMGATKRVAELIMQSYNNHTQTKFMAVRFGNVLGSRGSVIPRFEAQIARGGPITVTHAEMTRFFMTITEAAQLVIQAGALGQGGEIFILDMGEPIRIVDLASKLIRLSGLVPERDIKIEFTGIRTGEKIVEEIFTRDEQLGATKHERIYNTQVQKLDPQLLKVQLRELENQLNSGREVLLAKLHELVAEYQNWAGSNKAEQ